MLRVALGTSDVETAHRFSSGAARTQHRALDELRELVEMLNVPARVGGLKPHLSRATRLNDHVVLAALVTSA